MHELSSARALVRLVKEHQPPGSMVEVVQVQAGPLQAIVPEAMELAWQAVTMNTHLAGAKLQIAILPWRLRCLQCQRQWNANMLDATCACGSSRGVPEGGDELQLEYLEVTEPNGRGKVPNAVGK